MDSLYSKRLKKSMILALLEIKTKVKKLLRKGKKTLQKQNKKFKLEVLFELW